MIGEPDFSGRTAIVTGAAKGLGRAYARWLAAHGCAVVVSNRLTAGGESAAQETANEILAAGGRVVVHDGAVESEEAATEMADLARRHFGGIDIFVSNAGIVRWGEFGAVTIDQMREVIDINLWGCIFGLKAVWPTMVAGGYGRIVLTASSAGLWGQVQSPAYGTSKAAMIGLARSIALDVPEPADIHINVVAPAAYTPMSAAHLDERWADYCSADKVAPVVGWLSSDRCHSSGGIYHVGAGHVRRVQILEGPIQDLSSATLDEVMERLEPQPEWTSSFASGAELMPELAKAIRP
jgi:NAD(P)-dependent dehydrogenase (short-subunit alcohol dehydrogenase family)